MTINFGVFTELYKFTTFIFSGTVTVTVTAERLSRAAIYESVLQ